MFLWGLPGQYINYERALEIAGGRPLASPDLRDAVRCAALLLPGGGDMEPRRYGQANTASRGLEPERDTGELFLLEQFIMEKKPVLGICRGLQVLNVFFGGTLIQDLPGHTGIDLPKPDQQMLRPDIGMVHFLRCPLRNP